MMTSTALIAVLVAVITAIAFAMFRFRPRVSLRGLLALVALIATMLAATIGLRRAAMAQIRWLPVTSAEAISLHPQTSITQRDEARFQFDYASKRSSIDRLTAILSSQPVSWSLLPIGTHAVRVTMSDRSKLEAELERLRKADTLSPGAFVIRGLVRDRSGTPLSGAYVDILGRFPFINCFRTRDDGSFTMPLTDKNSAVPAGDGYYFRIRAPDEATHWHSAYFSITHNRPELVADIVVPSM